MVKQDKYLNHTKRKWDFNHNWKVWKFIIYRLLKKIWEFLFCELLNFTVVFLLSRREIDLNFIGSPTPCSREWLGKIRVGKLLFNCLGNMTSIGVFGLLILIYVTTSESHMFICHFKIHYFFFCRVGVDFYFKFCGWTGIKKILSQYFVKSTMLGPWEKEIKE